MAVPPDVVNLKYSILFIVSGFIDPALKHLNYPA